MSPLIPRGVGAWQSAPIKHLSKIQDGLFTADATGRSKFAEGFINDDLVSSVASTKLTFSPALQHGDILVRGESTLKRLAAGTSGQYLQTKGEDADPEWATVSTAGALADLTDVTLSGVAQGDMFYRGAADWNNLAVGTSGQYLKTQGAGSNPIWDSPVSTFDGLTDVSLSGIAQGDILYHGGTTWNNLGPGSDGQFLKCQGAGANPAWADLPGPFFMEFWSLPQEEVALTSSAGDKSLPDVTISGVPSGATIVYAVALFKFRMVENTDGSNPNKLNGVQYIQVRDDTPGTWTNSIQFVDDLYSLVASARESGEPVDGSIDISSIVDGNDTYNFQWDEAVADQSNLQFNDVQVGLRIFFTL